MGVAMMFAVLNVVEVAAAVGVVATAVIAIFVALEKITGWAGRWVQRQHQMADRDVDQLIRYHLGPNGDTPALWRRVVRIERRLDIDDTV